MAVTLVNGDICQLTTRALLVGQTCMNVVDYRMGVPAQGGTLEQMIQGWRTLWRDHILPLLTTSFVVEEYVAKRWSKVVGPYNQPRPRFDGIAVLAGDPDDDNGEVAGAFLPSYVAVSGKKVSDGPQSTQYKFGTPIANIVGAEKVFKGGIRLAGIVEADTEAAQGNDLTVTAENAFEDALDEMLSFIWQGNSASVGVANMVISSLYWEGNARNTNIVVAPPWVLALQDVTDLICSPLVGSQVSRKQRATGA